MRNLFSILLVLFFINCAGNANKSRNNKHRGKIYFTAQSQIVNDRFGISVNLNLPNSLFVFQKKDNQFEASYQLSIAILDSIEKQIQHFSWQESKSVTFFEETRSEAESIPTSHFFDVIPGKYSISILIEDLDSKYRWHKNIPLKDYKSDFISPILVNPDNINSQHSGYVGNIIPNKTEKINLEISFNFTELTRDSNIFIRSMNDGEIIHSDSIYIKKNSNTINYRMEISEYWMGDLELNFKYGKISEDLLLILPGRNSQYWKDINTTIRIMSYILTSTEIRELKELPKIDRIIFLKEYWKSLDPTPKTEQNEVMDEFFERVDYTASNFSEFGQGWQSDRGRVYILYGPPEHIEMTNQNNQGYKFEIWHYLSGKQFIFIDEGMFGNYRLYKEIN